MKTTVKMKGSEVERLYGLLVELTEVRQARLAYAIAKTRTSLRPLLEAMRDVIKPTPAAAQYEAARKVLLERHARKDSAGNPICVPLQNNPNAVQYLLEDKASFDKDFGTLREQHAQGVSDVERSDRTRLELLAEEDEVVIHCVVVDDLKEDDQGNMPITAGQLASLMEFGLIVEKIGPHPIED